MVGIVYCSFEIMRSETINIWYYNYWIKNIYIILYGYCHRIDLIIKETYINNSIVIMTELEKNILLWEMCFVFNKYYLYLFIHIVTIKFLYSCN